LGWPLTAGDPSLDELLQTPLGLRLGGSDPLCDSVDVRPLGPHFYQDPAEVRFLTDVGADGGDDRLQRPARRPRPEITEPGERSIDPRYEPAVPRVVELLKQSLFAFEVHIGRSLRHPCLSRDVVDSGGVVAAASEASQRRPQDVLAPGLPCLRAQSGHAPPPARRMKGDRSVIIAPQNLLAHREEPSYTHGVQREDGDRVGAEPSPPASPPPP